MRDISFLLIPLLVSFVLWIALLPLGRARALLGLPFCLAAIALLFWKVRVPLSREFEFALAVVAFASLFLGIFLYFRRLRSQPGTGA
jgi:hypothetical protein